jgi:CheY-like chemotaxis protein
MGELAPIRRRPRILFVDDQRDVARTLSTLLAPLGAEFRFAEDGETGLRRLGAEVFDLALVDLAMPPDDAGGLWLLRQLAHHRISTPTVVLSGQDGQDDTIEAQRLGAVDYVVKHKAAEELLEVVADVLANAAVSHWQRATTRLPTPVAVPLVESRLQTDALHRLRDSLHCAESVFRFTALAGAAAHRNLLAEYLVRPPAMGTWQALCRTLKEHATPPAIKGWLDAVTDRSVGGLVTARNEIAHSSGHTAAWVSERQMEVDDWLALFVTVATTYPAPRTVVAGKLEHTGEGFVVDVADIAGVATAVAWEHLRAPEPLRKGRVYLVVDNGLPPIDLWPLVLAEPAGRPGQWDVSVLDSVTRNDRLRHLNLAHGTRVDSATTLAELVAGHLGYGAG